MDLKAYEYLVRSESTARKYLLGFCWKNQQRFCPECRSRSFIKLNDGRRRCKQCDYVYHDFSRRWINLSRLSPDQWLRVVKLFELEVSARMIAKQVGLAYNTAHRAVTILRMAILAHSEDARALLSGEIELDESYFGGKRKGKRGRGAAGKVPVFGILSRGSQVFVQVVPNCKAETLLGLTVKKVRRGSIVYTDKYKAYDSLMFCGFRHLAVDHGKHFSTGKVYINGLEGFWSFAKERLIKHHGVSRKFFPLYLKELEFRYNYRQHDLFPELCRFLCDFVPHVE